MTSSRVGKAFHFKKSDLIQTSSEDVDYVTIVGYPSGQIVIELK